MQLVKNFLWVPLGATLLLMFGACSTDDDGSQGTDRATCSRTCDDGLFCNGAESCSPQSDEADEDGCVLSSSPCGTLTCNEKETSCVSMSGNANDVDGDGHDSVEAGGDDCDDLDPTRYPGNAEFCDSQHHDEDCDPQTNGGLDQDQDGFTDGACCNFDAKGALSCGDDCNGEIAWVFPGAPELCNGRDDDCDGEIDEDSPTTLWFGDEDGDGYGAFSDAVNACARPPGYTALPGDCDDAQVTVYPGAPELCDRLYNDCEDLLGGELREDEDFDDDGFASISAACSGGMPASDCADDAVFVNPGNSNALCDCSSEVDRAQCGNLVCDAGFKEGSSGCESCGTPIILAESPILHWSFDAPTSNEVTDKSGAGHHGAQIAGLGFPGIDLGGSSFYTGDRIYPNDDTIDANPNAGVRWVADANMPTDTLTFSFWYRASSLKANERSIAQLVSFGTDTQDDHFGIYGAYMELVVFTPSCRMAFGSLPADVGWHHMAVTYDSSALDAPVEVYIDGQQRTRENHQECTSSSLSSSGLLYLGHELDNVSCSGGAGSLSCTASTDKFQRWMGGIDEFSIFDRVLPEGTIQQLSSFGSCIDGSVCTGTTIEAGCRPVASCADVLVTSGPYLDQVQWLDEDGPAPGSAEPYQAYCRQQSDGGGWTLLTSHAADLDANWNYAGRALFTNDVLMGDANVRERDYKGNAAIALETRDWLFVHEPSGIWATYGIGASTPGTFTDHMRANTDTDGISCPNDWDAPTSGIPMYAMTTGILAANPTLSGEDFTGTGYLCDTTLFFSPGDGDSSCSTTAPFKGAPAWGPAWSGRQNDTVCFDDSHEGGLGPSPSLPEDERVGVGFGQYLKLGGALRERRMELYGR